MLDRAVNIFNNAWIRSKPLNLSEQPQPTIETLSPPAMNRHLTVIDFTGPLSRCDATLPAQVQGPKSMGMPTIAYARDLVRERHDINLSGEGPG